MTRLITKAALLSACGMLVAVSAMAGIPTAANSTSPASLRLVGSALSVPDSVSGKFTVTVRDVSLNPVTGSNVVVLFSGCTSDIAIASNQLNANYTVNCAAKTVSGFTNSAGQVAFTLLGGSFTSLVHTGLSCAQILADGVLLSSPTIGTFDMNGVGGISAGDLSVWLADLGAGGYRGRADYDGNGVVSAGDVSIWLGVLGRGKSNTSSTVCL
jgi:hypothetical protein